MTKGNESNFLMKMDTKFNSLGTFISGNDDLSSEGSYMVKLNNFAEDG